MRCSSCGKENPAGFSFCGHCGATLSPLCPYCGLVNPPGFSFCGHCGADLSQASLASLQSTLEGERRFVVVMFADIAGFTRLSEKLDPEEATKLVNRCLDEMTNTVVQHGGRVDKYTGDGLMAVFGAPTAHEDDPERALRAGLAMWEAMEQMASAADSPPISLHLGIACGQVVAAGVGGQGRREYTVIGTAVNLAARLEEVSAPGQILVSEEIARLMGHTFAFRPVVLPRLHGYTGEVQAYELLRDRPDTIHLRRTGRLHSPLVGRDTEIARLRQALEDLQNGRGGILSVIGETGIGKSRLLREACALADAQTSRLNCLEGHALETGEAVRYGCFRTLLWQAIGVGGQDSIPQVAAALRTSLNERMPGQADETYAYLARILGLPIPAETAERMNRLDGESLKWQTMRALRQWLAALVAQGPTVLIFEDLQWADPTSIEALEQIFPLTEQEALLIIGVYRPEPNRPAWRLREAAGQAHGAIYTELWLRPLDAAAAEQMVAHLIGSEHVPETAMQLILARAEGNPLFIEEIVRSLIDQGLLVPQDDTHWYLAPAWREVAIPDTIQGILQARIDRLDGESKRALQVAACIGRRFPYRLLADVAETTGLPRQRLDRCLRTLEEAALIERSDGSPDGEYAFHHILIHDTVHNSLLKGTRAQWHAAVARWYEEHALEDAEPPFALLAYHYEQTDDQEKQRFYFTQAGLQAARGYANAEARVLLTKALAMTTAPAERLPLLLERERICGLMGSRSQQRADLEDALQLARLLQDDGQLATVYNQLAYWHESQGDYPSSHAAAEAGLEAARRAHDRHAEAESLHRVASAAWRQGRFATALEAAQAALLASRAANDAPREATSLTTMGIVHRSRGEHDAARACYQQALDIHRAIGDRRGEAISLSQLGNVFFDLGDVTRAFDHHQQALDIFRLVGDRRGEAWSLSGLGSVFLTCGEYEAALARYEEALDIRRHINDRRGEGVALADLGNARLALGQLPAARDALEKAVILLRDIGARRDEVYALTYLARAMQHMGELDKAQALHQAALSRRRELEQRAASMENVAGLASVALEQGDTDTARAYIEEVLAYVRASGLTHIEYPFQLYQTAIRVMRAGGDEEAARQILTEACQRLRERAEGIVDPALRRSFLERVPENRALMAEWEAQKP